MPNTWMAQDLERNRKHAEEDTQASEEFVIRTNYARIEQSNPARPCACGSKREFRESVGAFKCPACGALETKAGAVL